MSRMSASLIGAQVTSRLPYRAGLHVFMWFPHALRRDTDPHTPRERSPRGTEPVRLDVEADGDVVLDGRSVEVLGLERTPDLPRHAGGHCRSRRSRQLPVGDGVSVRDPLKKNSRRCSRRGEVMLGREEGGRARGCRAARWRGSADHHGLGTAALRCHPAPALRCRGRMCNRDRNRGPAPPTVG
jgi:hypothetical protein